MISATLVSYVLSIIWLFFYVVTRKKQFTSKWYFYMLFIMASAGLFLDLDKELYYVTQTYSVVNILLFAVLLLLVTIPWYTYDEWLKNIVFVVNDKKISQLKKIYILLIILSLVCIVYCFPYAIMANSIGAYDVRHIIKDGGILPRSLMTTISAGIATLAPIGILLFFISLLDCRLKRFTELILLLPLAAVVHSMASAARELFIFLPITFVVLYTSFQKSISVKQIQKIKRFMLCMGILLSVLVFTITISRFGAIGTDSFIYGTWGYLFQQPYVFDQTIQYFDNYKGFSKSLPFVGQLIGVNTQKVDYVMSTEWSFGTMYKAFYEMYGYSSLIMGTILYICLFTIMSKKSIKQKNAVTILINFTLFVWFTISGLFYFRYGANDSQFILYILIILSSFCLPNFLKYKNVKSITNK